MHKSRTPQHLLEVLRGYADDRANDLAYLFLADGERDERRLTFGQLDVRARAIAALLAERGAAGERVLLIYEPGLDYIAALYGCLYAGAVAVPAYPLEPMRINRELPRLEAIVRDASARFVLTSEEILGWAEQLLRQTGEFDAVLSVDNLDARAADGWQMPDIDGDSLAILQYTSGSTGTPRGVMLGHSNLMHNLAQLDRLDSEGARGVVWLPPYHDMGLIGGILMPAFRGRSMVLMSPLSFVQRPVRWLEAISRYRGTSSASPNFGYELCLRKITDEECAGLDLSTWRLACNGAEPVRAETLERFYERFAPYGLRRETMFPCYGMAEATLVISGGRYDQEPVVRRFDVAALQNGVAREVAADDESARPLVGNGRPIADHVLRIVDPATCTALADGRVGEIWVQGPSIAQGYWGREALTRETFQARLANGSGPFLRTGDLGFVHAGELFITGRLKDLIIIAGKNHYPQDIEWTAHQAHEALRPDCGAAFSVDIDGQERLVIVQEVSRPKKWNLDEIIAAIRQAVALEHDLHAAAIVLIQGQRLPKTTSGKVQRRETRRQFLAGELAVLAEWRAAGVVEDASVTPVEPPQGETEVRLAEAWRDILGVAQCGRGDNFFDHGGHSLLAVQLLTRIAETFGTTLPLSALFEAPTLADLAARIDAAAVDNALAPLVRATDRSRQPASCGQAGLWFLDRLHGGRGRATIAATVRLEGPLSETLLRETLATIVRRHEPLRTSIDNVDGVPFQVIADEIELPWETIDLAGLDPTRQEREIARLAESEAGRPFTLSRGPLWRIKFVRLGEDRHAMVMALHHAVADGASLAVLRREWSALYQAALAGHDARLPELTAQYRDYVATQRRDVSGSALATRLKRAEERLRGAAELALPFDHAPDRGRGFDGACVAADLPFELAARLTRLARAQDATLFMTLLAAWQVLLYRWTAQSDVSVGAPVAARTRREYEGLFGFLANTLVVRSDLSGGPSFADLLRQVRQNALLALEAQDIPLERLVEAIHPHRDPLGHPLFQTLFALEELPDCEAVGAQDPGARLPRIAAVEVDYRRMLPLPISLVVEQRGAKLRTLLVYDRNLFDEASIRDLLSSWLTLLESAAADPGHSVDTLRLAADDVQERILGEWNNTYAPRKQGQCIVDLIAAQTARTPHAVAAQYGQRVITYAELDARSGALAGYLTSRGIGRGALVGLYCDRSLDMLIGLLGVLKSGAAYVPVDPRYPRERVELMMSDADVALVLTQQRLVESLPGGQFAAVCLDRDWLEIVAAEATPPQPAAAPDDLAYVIYTSGSTGRPKGVEVTHRGIVNMLSSSSLYPGLAAGDVFLAITTLSFDIAVVELLMPLTVGARTVITESEIALDPVRLAATIRETKASIMQATPVTWRMLVDSGWQPAAGFRVFCGGEALEPTLAARLLDLGVDLWNLYGPTETSVWSSSARLTPGTEVITIGRPMDNTLMYVLDARGQLVPPGVIGELYIGGAGVARGYHNRPELTAERFVSDPFAASGGRMYRTGDLARWRHDGTLECLGRVDHQVKLRGFRIELGEIEAVLREHPEIRDVVVVARDIAGGDKRLVAYYVAGQRRAAPAGELRGIVERRLPAYMVPSAFVELPQLPRTPNGKIDRGALPDPTELDMPTDRAVVAPRNEFERKLHEIWFRLLGFANFGVEDSFFDIGGHSLLAVQMVAQVEREFARWIPVATLFERSTIAELAELLRRPTAADSSSPLVPVQRRGTQRPVFCVHPAGGTVFCYLELTKHLGADQPIYGLQARGLDGEAEPHGTVEEMAAAYIALVRQQQPRGPYRLAGWSFGGVVAFEMAQQMRRAGDEVETLIVFDTVVMPPDHPTTEDDILQTLVEMLHGEDQLSVRELRALSHDEQLEYFRSRAERARLVASEWSEERFSLAFQVFQSNLQALFRYRPQPYEGSLVVLRATEKLSPAFNDPQLGWGHWVRGSLQVHDVACEHLQMFRDPWARQIGQFVARLLATGPASCNPPLVASDPTLVATR